MACAGFAVFLAEVQKDEGGGIVAGATYRSELLNNEVPIASLRAVALSDSFRNSAGGRVILEEVPEDPYFVKVYTITPSVDQAQEVHERARSLLSVELKQLATAGVSSSLEYLHKLRERNERSKSLVMDRAPQSTVTVERSFSEKDLQRVLLLREQISQAESFLAGGDLSKTLKAELDREALSNAEERVRRAERELGRLAQAFSASSKSVQAQQSSLSQARSDLLALQKETVRIFLRTKRLELENLDDKAASLVTEEVPARLAQDLEPPKPGDGSEVGAWISDRIRDLDRRTAEIAQASELKLSGKVLISERGGYEWAQAAAWLAALGALLGALFVGLLAEKNRGPQKVSARAPSQPVAPVVRLEIANSFQQSQAPDRLESFFLELGQELELCLGRVPRRILVLADTPVDTRLSFSIRLANSIGKTGEKVRLVDFDLQEKGLSERLGRESLPGVGELLANGGPVEEFFSSIAGTRIQFAPAGCASTVGDEIDPLAVDRILGIDSTTVIDGSSASPLHLIVRKVDAVLVTTQVELPFRSEREKEVLAAFRDAGLPIWGVSPDASRFFRLL